MEEGNTMIKMYPSFTVLAAGLLGFGAGAGREAAVTPVRSNRFPSKPLGISRAFS